MTANPYTHGWFERPGKTGWPGATVLRGLEGFGASSRVHTARILRLSTDLPIVVEIVDKYERIEAFLPLVDEALEDGLVTLEKVHIRLYRSSKAR